MHHRDRTQHTVPHCTHHTQLNTTQQNRNVYILYIKRTSSSTHQTHVAHHISHHACTTSPPHIKRTTHCMHRTPRTHHAHTSSHTKRTQRTQRTTHNAHTAHNYTQHSHKFMACYGLGGVVCAVECGVCSERSVCCMKCARSVHVL